MAIQGHLGDASLGHDPIDTDRLHPMPAEEVVRRAEYAPARVVVRLLDLIGLRRPGRGRVTVGTVMESLHSFARIFETDRSVSYLL